MQYNHNCKTIYALFLIAKANLKRVKNDNAGLLGLGIPRPECPPACNLSILKNHKKMNRLTHIISLKGDNRRTVRTVFWHQDRIFSN